MIDYKPGSNYSVDDFSEYHWVVLETEIKEHPGLNKYGSIEYELDFKVFTWGGKKEYLKEHITLQHFINNFYGYIKIK